MSDATSDGGAPTLRILDEETIQRGDAPDDAGENPYWSFEEVPPHPAPEKGCIRRGLCCRTSPGWFAPGEVEAAAELLHMSPDAFVRTYVVIDAVEVEVEPRNGAVQSGRSPIDVEGPAAALDAPDDLDPRPKERVEVFVPVKLGRDGEPLAEPGTRVDDLYRMFRSPCVFYDHDAHACQIYGARPLECRRYVCTNPPEENLSHAELGRMWRDGVASNAADDDAAQIPDG